MEKAWCWASIPDSRVDSLREAWAASGSANEVTRQISLLRNLGFEVLGSSSPPGPSWASPLPAAFRHHPRLCPTRTPSTSPPRRPALCHSSRKPLPCAALSPECGHGCLLTGAYHGCFRLTQPLGNIYCLLYAKEN